MTEEVINNKLNYLEETKDLIASSIESYGVDVNENDTFRSYASKIREIPKINPEDYYTKVETNNLIDEKISEIPAPDLSNYYTKSETEGKINELDTGVMTINGRKPNPNGNIIIDTPDMSEYYDKLQIDNKVQELNTAISEGDTLTLSEAKSYADTLVAGTGTKCYLHLADEVVTFSEYSPGIHIFIPNSSGKCKVRAKTTDTAYEVDCGLGGVIYQLITPKASTPEFEVIAISYTLSKYGSNAGKYYINRLSHDPSDGTCGGLYNYLTVLNDDILYTDIAQTISAVKTFSSLPESSVVPTTNNQLVNKKYVDDAVAAGMDLSNYYTKTETNSQIDTKIAAIPVADLLHFKGHVASVNDLPSLGQVPAQYQTPNLRISNYLSTLTVDAGNLKSYINSYIIDTGSTHYIACVRDDNYHTRRFVGTKNPEIFDGIAFGCSDTSSTMSEVNAQIFVHVNASASKPAYTRCYGDLSAGYTGITYDDGTGGAINSATITRPFWYQVSSLWPSTYMVAKITTDIKYRIPDISKYWYCNDWRGTSSQKDWNKPKTVTVPSFENGYIYDNGMYMLRASQTGEIFSLIGSGAVAKENDVYTVGSLNKLYRCNLTPAAWEYWSQADLENYYTKAQVDTLIGGIEGFTTYVGDESDYDIMPPEQKAAYDLFILDRNVELTQEELTSLCNILGDDSETISDMSENAANEALSKIIEPQEEVA